MATLLYIHGFLSSPTSAKAQQVAHWLTAHRPDIQYLCPQLTPYPDQCSAQLSKIIESSKTPIYLIGSSMGGFWATWLTEQYQKTKAVLINPAVDVLELMPAYLDQPLQNYHNTQIYYLTSNHLKRLTHFVVDQPQQLERYWLLVQTGDETLDYRLAVEKYAGCRQTIELGGNHSFQSFENVIPNIIDFFEFE